MTRIAFCDDDAALLHQMQDFLEQYRTLRGVQLELAPYTKPMELLADIEAGVRFDVLFLDVLMPGINGINAAREIRRYDTAVQIIFVTSSSEFAVQSYVVGAYYYQLKPIWKDSFFRLTDAVLAECRKRTQHSLILRCKSGVTRITLDSLEYCEVQCQFGIVPLVGYLFDYITHVYTSLLSEANPAAVEFMFFVCCAAFLCSILRASRVERQRIQMEQLQTSLNLQVTQAMREIEALRLSQQRASTYRTGHGLGVRSICAISERYGGLTSFAARDGQFTLRVML